MERHHRTDLYTALGGEPAIAGLVDELYQRLTTDAVVRHHFAPERLDSLKAAQREWFRAALSGSDQLPSDLGSAHAHLVITDAEIAVVIGHLDAVVATATDSLRLRRAVLSLVGRLWHARRF